VVVIVWQLGLQLPMLSVSITTKVSSVNPVHGVVNSIQRYVIEVVRDLQQVVVSSCFHPPIKLTANI
jgi:hypothetical protein